jgi:hypothetical protein
MQGYKGIIDGVLVAWLPIPTACLAKLEISQFPVMAVSLRNILSYLVSYPVTPPKSSPAHPTPKSYLYDQTPKNPDQHIT